LYRFLTFENVPDSHLAAPIDWKQKVNVELQQAMKDIFDF
jgi:hypothetical protein